ncbi:hypothetical protein JCM33374_g1268 [Metschnikowia sp. JCM 33374]|nr:hypothetical protein JCM33374_g1268 [Metschnikowia sp. JCM 33374]
MTPYTMDRNPTLYSLFETKESIELFGPRTTLSNQRYIAAWDFSAQLCSIEHPGIAPCFFPSDFSVTPGRRSAQSITTLVERCPSLIFYEQYHERMMADCDTYLPDDDEQEVIVSGNGTYPKPISPADDLALKSSPTHEIQDAAIQPNVPGGAIAKNTGNFPVHEKFAPSTCNILQKQVNDEKTIPRSTPGMVLKTMDGIGTCTNKVVCVKPEANNIEKRSSCEENSIAPSNSKIEHKLTGTRRGSIKRSFIKNFQYLKRSFSRKCVNDSGFVLINEGRWKNAEDTFIRRLTHEFRDLQNLIQDFMEIG